MLYILVYDVSSILLIWENLTLWCLTFSFWWREKHHEENNSNLSYSRKYRFWPYCTFTKSTWCLNQHRYFIFFLMCQCFLQHTTYTEHWMEVNEDSLQWSLIRTNRELFVYPWRWLAVQPVGYMSAFLLNHYIHFNKNIAFDIIEKNERGIKISFVWK